MVRLRGWLFSLTTLTLLSQSVMALAALQPEQVWVAPAIAERQQVSPVPVGSDDGDFPTLLNPQPYTSPLVFAEQEDEVQAAATDALTINLAYGNNQTFGALGIGTEQINLIGSVSSAVPVTSLSYTLNSGSSEALSLGGQPDIGITDPNPAPANPRLVDDWDFNLEIPATDLNSGDNQVVITAVDQNGSTSQNVTVNYQNGNSWPLPYFADWSEVNDLQSTGHIIDGRWAIVNGVLRPQQIGYDRLVGMGDINWENYEVQVPITVHGIDESGFLAPSNGPGIGIIVRWLGHLDDTNYTGDEQPMRGWRRLGGVGLVSLGQAKRQYCSGLQLDRRQRPATW